MLWLQARLVLAVVAVMTTVWGPVLAFDLLRLGLGEAPVAVPALGTWEPHRWYAPLAVLPAVGTWALLVALGDFVTFLARLLLGPSTAERLSLLEERTERLLERTRIARELHDSIGHALTVAVVQAGAARAAGDAEFTERALAAIEEIGRGALEDLERVLLVLRESTQPVSGRPTLLEADRLLEAARSSGADVDAELSGPLKQVPGPVSREGYRILQEALTNVLRHSGPVPIRVRMAVIGRRLEMDVTNPLPGRASPDHGGSRLRGIRERTALLGGKAQAGPWHGEWRVRVRLPLDGAGVAWGGRARAAKGRAGTRSSQGHPPTGQGRSSGLPPDRP
ncbi:signal transduction histidine kinase [Kitasatospora sp. GP82]|nr:signal transduction histidine kinase [Kitasatospora sp. GP82]